MSLSDVLSGSHMDHSRLESLTLPAYHDALIDLDCHGRSSFHELARRRSLLPPIRPLLAKTQGPGRHHNLLLSAALEYRRDAGDVQHLQDGAGC